MLTFQLLNAIVVDINGKYKLNKKPDKPYYKFKLGSSTFGRSVMKKDNKNILCKLYEFPNLGAFLYFDLFRGVYNNYIPKKCENCGRYFLIQSGKYTDYCENPAPQDPTKTCRDVGYEKNMTTNARLIQSDRPIIVLTKPTMHVI